MTHPPSRAILTAAAIVMLLNACTPTPTEPASPTPEETSMSIQQEGAPYPSDLDHLDDILALGKTALPEGATNITITPATKFAESYPGGWGYVIAYHADPQPIRNHIDTYTSHSGDNIEDYPDTEYLAYIKDIDFTAIQHPWVTGFGKVQLVVERPLGRCWLLIRGAPR
ncbi:hypothetical protein J5A61_10345 [Arachnia propionica]|nr:hypothetical protein J5A61_10345 [Arachnia propionica]